MIGPLNPGLPSKREMARMWSADQELIRALMPIAEQALDLAPPSEATAKLEATYALVMERYLAAYEDARAKSSPILRVVR